MLLVSHIRLKLIAVFLVPSIALIGGYSLHNRIKWGVFRISDGMGFSLLNYVGRPDIYRNLPPEMNHIKAVFVDRANKLGTPVLGWPSVLQPLTVTETDWDRAARRIAMAAIFAAPKQYFHIWLGVAREYLFDYFVWYGLYRDATRPTVANEAQVNRWRYCLTRVFEFGYLLFQPFLGVALLLVPIADRRPHTITLWLAFLTCSLANTLVDPALGQARYRMPWQGIMILIVASGIERIVNRPRFTGSHIRSSAATARLTRS